MRQKNERNIDLIHSSRTRDGGGGKRGKKNIHFPLKESNFRPSEDFLSFLVNEPWHTVDT